MKWRVEHCRRRRCYCTLMTHFKRCPLPILPWTNTRIYLLRNNQLKQLAKHRNANSKTSSIQPRKTSIPWDRLWNRRKPNSLIPSPSDHSVEPRSVRKSWLFRKELRWNHQSVLAFSCVKWLPSTFGFISKRERQWSILVRLWPTH